MTTKNISVCKQGELQLGEKFWLGRYHCERKKECKDKGIFFMVCYCRYTEHSTVGLAQQWDQLNQLGMRIRHNLEQQIQVPFLLKKYMFLFMQGCGSALL
jgi:hypothetical protein